MFSQIKDRKHIEQNFHSVAKVMPRVGTEGCWGSQNFCVGICNGAPSTARSSYNCGKLTKPYTCKNLCLRSESTIPQNLLGSISKRLYQKLCNTELWILICSACYLVLLNTHEKFHENNSYDFQAIERTHI